jgi:hypothetical protein
MNFAWLSDLSTEFHGIGLAPTAQEMLAMNASIPALVREAGYDAVHFWGKLIGTARNYLIIACYAGGLLGRRTYYGSVDGVGWFGLPLVTAPLLFHTSHIRARITGNPLTKTPVRHPHKPEAFKEFAPLVPPKPRNEEEEEEEDKPEPEEPKEEEKEEEEEVKEEEDLSEFDTVVISEDQRVACAVHRIDKNGLIFPSDALIWSSSSTVTPNPLFKGMRLDATLDDFCRIEKNTRGEEARTHGLVDTMPLLSEDLPARGWKLSTSTFTRVLRITSKLWPGLVFITKGPHWGTVYLGNGEKNVEFLFATLSGPKPQAEELWEGETIIENVENPAE